MALTDKLSAIGTAIREKTGKSDLITLDAMPEEIRGIQTGGGDLPEEAFVVSGDCSYRFAYGGWNWFVENYGNKVKTVNITNMPYMFYNSKIKNIPFELNPSGSYCECTRAFSMTNITSIPIIKNLVVYKIERMFGSAELIREIDEEVYNTWDWSKVNTSTSAYSGAANALFDCCYSLRALPIKLLENGNPICSSSYSIYSSMCSSCYTLDEIVDLPNPHLNATWTSNTFSSSFDNTHRLKNLIFRMPDGMPYVVQWKSQVIDMSKYVGYAKTWSYITNFNSGITAEKEVKDDATYQSLKDDPDWWALDISYSRYNHDSAVATINSLPDASAYLASAGGTNTIKFKGASGALTDGGAINTMTEEEIAVAAAKGWTVSLV